MEDYNDSFYIDRGIDPGVAHARGYRFWDEETAGEVMEAMYGHLGRTGVMMFARSVGRQGPGVVFPRHAPEGFKPITAGLRPDSPVKLSPPKRHFHGAPRVHLMDIEVWPLLPEKVEFVYASPQRGRVKVYFEHEHDVFDHAHSEVWHPRESETMNHPEGQHGHTFYVYETSSMRKHIDQTKNPDSHGGINPEGVHAHQKRAKYLYTPSEKLEVSWPTDHDHEGLKGKGLEHHLEVFHAAGAHEH